jgi:ABC-type Co2+ transport system permease subunit
MTPTLAALLVGAFGVPALLIWAAHRLRRRSARWHAAFWGALTGHVVSATVAIVAAMIPPEAWSGEDVVRGLLGVWSLVLGPAIGAAVGLARVRRYG